MLLQVLEVLLVTAGLGYFLIQLLNHINDKGEKESDDNEEVAIPIVEELTAKSTEEIRESESTEEVKQDSIETQSDVIDEAILDELGQMSETVSPRIDEEVDDETKKIKSKEIKSRQTLSDTIGGKTVEELEQLAAEDVGGDAEEITAEIDKEQNVKTKEFEKTKKVKESEVEDTIESAKVVDDLFRDVLPDDVIAEDDGPVTTDGVTEQSEKEMLKEGARSESESAVVEEVKAEEDVSPKIVETITEKVTRSDDVVDLNEDDVKDEDNNAKDAKDAKNDQMDATEALDDDDFNVLDEFGDEQLLLLNFGKASRPKKPRVRKSVKKVFSESWKTSVFEVSFVSASQMILSKIMSSQ